MVELAAGRDHALWIVKPHRPARKIHEVRRVVRALARSPRAAPVPVVVHDVVAVAFMRNGTLPERPVEPLRNLREVPLRERLAGVLVPGAREVDVADDSGVDLLHRGERDGRAAALRAHLEDRARLLLDAPQDLELRGRRGTRLLDVDRLPGLHRRDRGPRMPVVRRRADKSVDPGVVQRLPEVDDLLRTHAGDLLHLVRRGPSRTRVDIAHRRDLNARKLRRALHELEAPPLRVAAHDREPHAVRRRARPESPSRSRDREKPRGTTDEFTSLHFHFSVWLTLC